MNDVVCYEVIQAIAVITIDNPPINAVSKLVRQQLVTAFNKAEKDKDVDAILLRCDGRTFIAGADISEFDKPIEDPHLIEVINVIENTSKLTVVAMHGTTLGGGLETALGADYRCALTATKLGFPEVTLGIIPGANGTQRLPRLVGAEQALDMIASGKLISADQALAIGLIDRIIEGDLLSGALEYTRELLTNAAVKRRVSTMEINPDSYSDILFEDYRKIVSKRMRNQQAPLRAIDAVRAATGKMFNEGVKVEEEIAQNCLDSVESAAMRHLFFASRTVSKIPGMPKDIPIRDIKQVAIVGAGIMGSGITMNFINAGIPVTLVDTSENLLERGLATIRKNYSNSVKKGRVTENQLEERMALIRPTIDFQDIKTADLVIEAVYENMELKKGIFKKIDGLGKNGVILASNTSTLNLNEIAESISRPGDVIGLHFFSPANVMRLLEIIRCDKTADDVLATALSMAKTIKKIGVVSGVCYGFIGNRMMEGYGREANMLLLEGALPDQVDKALYEFGMAMGPFAMFDMGGTDVGYKVHQDNAHLLPDDDRYYLISHKVAEMGRYGQKTGAGVYKYENGSRVPINDPEIIAMIEAESSRLGIKRRDISDTEIIERCIYPLINEAALILEEGIALRPGDIDIVWTNGYGFPAYRGGPLFYADTISLQKVLKTINRISDETGNKFGYWTPAALLQELVESGKKFADLN